MFAIGLFLIMIAVSIYGLIFLASFFLTGEFMETESFSGCTNCKKMHLIKHRIDKYVFECPDCGTGNFIKRGVFP